VIPVKDGAAFPERPYAKGLLELDLKFLRKGFSIAGGAVVFYSSFFSSSFLSLFPITNLFSLLFSGTGQN
jgi:hypothetical protein